ncbi:MAG: hypothetical protein ACKVRN_07545 [Pyrinomonadaceae bacterium]
MRFIFTAVLFFLTAFSVQNSFAQCSLTNDKHSSVFIAYKQTAKVKNENGKSEDGVILRLQNNTNCSIIVETGSADKFYKPLPENPTVMQRVKREIEYDLPDNALVPEVQYLYNAPKTHYQNRSVGGDMFFGFRVLGNRSILFEVPLKYFNLKYFHKIIVPFQYDWELKTKGGVFYSAINHNVNYSGGDFPEELLRKIEK